MKDKLKLILAELQTAHDIDEQQALKFLISNIKEMCFDLHLDFDCALDKSDPSVEFISNGCDHALAYPCGGDSVFCPKCSQYLVQGRMKGIDGEEWIRQNHWR